MFEGHCEWADDEKAVLDLLGLTRVTSGIPYTATGTVWFAKDEKENMFALKLVYKESYEIKALEKLRSLPSPRNRTIPGCFFECQKTYVFVMPYLDKMWFTWALDVTWPVALDNLYVLIDAVQFMHENDIAFIDISTENTVWANRDVSFGGFNISKREIFLIDFGSARVLPAGPGLGVKIHDIKEYGGKWEPSEGFDAVDPYAYDIYCLGILLYRQLSHLQEERQGIYVPRVWFRFADTLIVKEPSRRPSIFRVRRQFSALRWWTSRTSWMYKKWTRFAENFEYQTWRIISIFVR